VERESFAEAARDLECVREDFEGLRSVLRVLPPDGPSGIVHEDPFETLAEVEAYEQEAKALCEALRKRLAPESNATDLKRNAARTIVTHMDEYSSGLFGHALVTDNGGLLLVDRTNNGDEREHRFSKRCRRRVHGRSRVKHDLERWPGERALVYNLRNPLYVRTVYGTLEALPEKFAGVLDKLAAVQAEAQPEEATVRLTRKRRKGRKVLDNIEAIRRLIAGA